MVQPEKMLEVCSYCLVLNILWILFSWRALGGSLFSPYILFMASVSVFNYGQVVLEVLGLNHDGLLGLKFPPDLLAETVLFVLFATSALTLGAFITAAFPSSQANRLSMEISDATLREVAGLLFLIALLPSIVEMKRAITLGEAGGYMAIYRSEAAVGFNAYTNVLCGFLVPSSFLLMAGSRKNPSMRIIACSIIGIYVMLQGFLGFRAGAIVVLVTSLWLWHVTITPIPRKIIISLALVAMLILPVIGVLRVLPADERTSFSAWQSTYAEIDNPLIALIREMGGSMAATAYTITLVPDLREYEHGATYAYALSTLAPNLFWTVHPGVLNSPSKWLVETVSPETALAGGGFGFSILAEGYLNFGFQGAALPMLLIGWGIGSLSCRSEMESSPLMLCFIALSLIPLLIYARAEAGNAVRGIVWYGGIPYLLIKHWPRRARAKVQLGGDVPAVEPIIS